MGMWRCDAATRFVLAALAGLVSAAFGRPLLGLVVAVPWRPRALLAATALLAAAWGGQRVADLDHRALRPGAIETVVVVTSAPNGDRAIVRVPSAAEDVLLVARRGQRPLLGGVYRAAGRLQPPDPAVRGYYATQGVHLELRASRLTALGMRGGGWALIDRLHAGAIGRLAAGRDPSPQRALVAGVTLGDTSGMSAADREAFRASGLYHLVSVDIIGNRCSIWRQMNRTDLDAHDQPGYQVVDALSHHGPPPSNPAPTHASPHRFVCMDGGTYYAKATAQQGLAAELIASRLAARCGAGPPARVIRVHDESVPADGSADRFKGIIVGIEDRPDMVNLRDLALLGVTALDPVVIRPQDRATVVVFQSWIGVGDQQLMVNLRTGTVSSLDHGECFASPMADPQLSVLSMPGIPDTHGNGAHALAAIDVVESITDDEIMRAVANMPVGAVWRSGADRRFEIAQGLAHRRDHLRGVIVAW
jgi:hypothetical protein